MYLETDLKNFLQTALEVTGTSRWSDMTIASVIKKLQENFLDEDIAKGLDYIASHSRERLTFAYIEETIAKMVNRKNKIIKEEKKATADEKELVSFINEYTATCFEEKKSIDEYFEGLEPVRDLKQKHGLFDMQSGRWAKWVIEHKGG